MLHVVGCQWDLSWHDPAANFAAVRALLEHSPPRSQPALIVLPEMFNTGFSLEVNHTAEPAGGATETFLSQLAAARQSFVIGGLTGRAVDGRGQNQALVFGPAGEQLARYVKLHPFSFADENRFFEPGRDVQLFTIGEWQVAPFVCYDLRFPEIFRRAVQRGANLLVVIANWPSPRLAHWRALLIARAIENQCFVIGINRCGNDPKLAYPGHSMIVDPRGEVSGELGDGPGLLLDTLDYESVSDYRRLFPALADLRPEFLGS